MSRRFTIGRDRASDIPIADESVSRMHAEIWLADDGALMLCDRGSSNGTELIRDGHYSQLAQGPVLMTDQVRFGAATFPVKDLVDAIQSKYPGALTPGLAPRPPVPPSIPAAPPVVQARPIEPPRMPGPPAPPPMASPPRIPAPPPIPSPPPLHARANAAPDFSMPPPFPASPASPVGGAPRLPPPPPPLPSPPPVPMQSGGAQHPSPPPLPPRAGAGPLIRCECGAIKSLGQVCPGCHK